MGWILGPYEAGAPARFADGVPDWFGTQPLRGRPRSAAAARRGGRAPRAGARELRHQGHRQRPDLLHPRRQSAHRARLGRAQRVAQRGPQLRHHRRRRLRLAAGRVDRRGRAGHRHAGGRSAPLRRLHQQALRGAEERGNLPQRLRHPLPGRGARRRAPGEDQPGVRQARRAWARSWASATAGSAPTGSRRRECERKDHWSFRRSQLLRARRQRSAADARARRRHRSHPLHQARGDRPRRGGAGSTALVANKVPTKIGRMALSPRAHAPRRHPLGVHHHQDRATSTSTW